MWQTPKIDWDKNSKTIEYEDLNRIENNILYLYEEVLI